MSVLHYPESAAPTINSSAEMQIWNNAAFDDEPDASTEKVSSSSSSPWWSQSLNSSTKENLNPLKQQPKRVLSTKISIQDEEEELDVEIEEIEKEIRRLSSRLEALRLEKAERRRGKIAVAENHYNHHHSVTPFPSSVMKPKISRRGFSLGPAEIASKARLLTKLETAATGAGAATPRRKSCFWKIGEIDELKVTKERGKSQSVSPKSRSGNEVVVKQQAQTTKGTKRPAVKKDEGAILALIQPKTLFGEKSVTSKKQSRPGRIVASRYNQISASATEDHRKRSLPESEKDDGNKRRASRGDGLLNVKVKKKWEIPNEVVIFKDQEGEEISLAKIRTCRRPTETPRDSGAAKRVAELVGKKSFFADDEGSSPVEGSVCLTLSFDE
ncbi:hypothetical protein LINPERHAP2_LOCUS23703 [Linum perenne]